MPPRSAIGCRERRIGFFLGFVLVLFTSHLVLAQDAPVRHRIGIGQSRDTIAKECGKPFEKSREDSTGFNVPVGVPPGMWTVYHLTPFENRMYVTMLHFDPNEKVDGLMLMPTGFWTVAQHLRDHPLLARICSGSCQVIQVPENDGRLSLLLKPDSSSKSTPVLFFTGDSGSRFKSVSSMDSIVSWSYVLPLTDFEKHHLGLKTRPIGRWKP